MASTDSKPQILVTGVTGYIGGTILTHLLDSPSPVFKNAGISCLLRGADRAAKITAAYGGRVRTILHKDMDDVEGTEAAAAQHDLVINAGAGFHPTFAQALVRGLAQRKAATGRPVWLIHTSGVSNLCDYPITKKWVEADPNFEQDDARDDLYAYEKKREEEEGPYGQRTAELAAVDLSVELGVGTVAIISPCIFGRGVGLFHKSSIQIPDYVRAVLKRGRGFHVGDGRGEWDRVHVEDLADLYLLVAERMLRGGEGVPVGRKGLIFSANGRQTFAEMAREAADAAFEKGLIGSRDLDSIGLAEGAKLLLGGEASEEFIEKGFASNARGVASVARSLGWKPTRGEKAFKENFREELEAELEQRKQK